MPQPTAFRLDDATDVMIDQLAAALGMTRTGVIRHAVRKLHRAEKLPIVEGKPLGERKPRKGRR